MLLLLSIYVQRCMLFACFIRPNKTYSDRSLRCYKAELIFHLYLSYVDLRA